MKKICTVSGDEFEVTEDDLKFYEKMGVPTPTLCPEERQKRRYIWRNERNLFNRKCDSTGQNIVAMYPPDSPFKIYNQETWWSDKWDALSYGRDFDFSRPFFEQFRKLQLEVPRVALVNKNSSNCTFTNHSANNKNCYLSSVTFNSEDIYYSNWIIENCSDLFDCSYMFGGSQLCYSCYYVWGCYQALFCEYVKNCQDLWFCYDCIGCQYCFMCSNLRQKKYCIKNKQYTKEDYEKIMTQIFPLNQSKLQEFRDHYEKMKMKTIMRATYNQQAENSSGNMLFNAKNTEMCFDCIDMEDTKFCIDTCVMKNSMDIYHAGWAELMYESHAVTGYQTMFSHFCYDNTDITYSDSVHNSKNLFGCVGMNHKQYCILNKQYDQKEYFTLRKKIIDHMKQSGEWGEFFPMELAPFAYNISEAQSYFPLTKKEALTRKLRWHDGNLNNKVEKKFETPKMRKDADNKFSQELLECKCGKSFKVIPRELKYYQNMGLPIPKNCPLCRYYERFKLRKERKLWKRKCDKCGVDIQTTFAPERPEQVFCEKCYLDSVE